MTRTTHRKRHARTDILTGTYARLRREGTPTFVTSHEAYRMTDGRVGTRGDHNLRHGFTLMALVKKADGDVHSLSDDPATCTHAEPLPVPGLDDVTVCMDCGHTSVPEPDGADDGTTGQARVEVQEPRTPPRKGDVVSYSKPFLAKGDAPLWRVRHVDPSDGTLTLDLLGHSKRSTARFNVHPGRVTIRTRAQG